MRAGLPLLFALLLAVLAMVATLVVSAFFPVGAFPAISYACTVNGLAAERCAALAKQAGLLVVAAYGVVLAFALWRRWLPGGSVPDEQPDADSPSRMLFAIASLTVMGAHSAILLLGPARASRLNETEFHSHLVSVENLLLPLVLQLYVSAHRDGPLRRVLLATLLLGMALSPYRAMVMALYLFGLLLPLMVAAWKCGRHGFAGWRRVVGNAVVVLVIGVGLAQAGIQDTEMRSPTLLAHAMGWAQLPPQHADLRVAVTARDRGEVTSPIGEGAQNEVRGEDGEKVAAAALLPPVDMEKRIAQRIAFPLYQAAIAGHLADTGVSLPTLSDQVLRKLRLSDTPNLEEFLFRRIFGGKGHGETTSLTYGESQAYFPWMPLAWMIAVPALLVLAWRSMDRRGVACGTLFGLALWRSMFSGLFPILPALMLQGGGLWVLHRLPLTACAALFRAVLVSALGGALLVQAWNLASLLSGRRDILYARFELAPGCWLEYPSLVPKMVGLVGDAHGYPMVAVMVAHHRTALMVALPYGQKSQALLDENREAIAQVSHCANSSGDSAPPGAVRLLDTHLIRRMPNLLEYLVALAMALAVPWPRQWFRFRRG